MRIFVCLLLVVLGVAFLVGQGDTYQRGDVVRYRPGIFSVDRGEMTVVRRLTLHVSECYLVTVDDPNYPEFMVDVDEVELVSDH